MKESMSDVVVVGGGLVGATFALDLAIRCPHLKISILEQNPINTTKDNTTGLIANLNSINNIDSINNANSMNNVFDSRIYAIAPYNVTYLERLGVVGLDNPHRVATVNNMLVYGDKNSRIFFERQLGQQLFLAKNLEGSYLLRCIYTRLMDLDNVNLIHDSVNNVKIRSSNAEIFGQHGVYLANLLVIANGANSNVVSMVGLDGANVNTIDYDQMGIVANFACELPHNNTAYQWFLKDGVLAYLPLPNNHISIVWGCYDASAKLNLSEDAFTNLVIETTHAKLGNLKLISKVMAFPLKLALLQKVYTNRAVLIGDTAHTINPLAGQGLNLGFADSQVLANILSGAQKYQIGDIGLLAKYNNVRLPEVRKMQMTCHVLQRLFGANSGVCRYLRNAGLNLVDSLPLVKKQLIKQSCMFEYS